MVMRRALKWPVPVDGEHHLVGVGKVLLVGTQNGDVEIVNVWTEEVGVPVNPTRRVRVYGTGEAVPDWEEHLGSVVAIAHSPVGQSPVETSLVWHVYGDEI